MKQSKEWEFLSPSSTLLEFANVVAAPTGSLTLDLACGFGRNAVLMAAHGCNVIGVDQDLLRLHKLEISKSELLERCPLPNPGGTIRTVCAKITEGSWPFAPNIFDTIICVHFVFLKLIPCLLWSLRHGGYIYLETFGGQGENYLDLPHAGETRTALGNQVNLIYLREKPASRKHSGFVSVRALARKN